MGVPDLKAHHGTMRLFIGIPLAAAAAAALAAITKRLQRAEDGLRWSTPESWHITLQFLGNTTPQQYSCVAAQLRQLTAPDLTIEMEGFGFFDRAGVFHAAVRVTPDLLLLQQRVLAASSRCGFVAEDRPYHPHITLARSKGGSHGIRNLKQRFQPGAAIPGFTAREFLLYESFLGPGGSRYQVRERFPLSGN